MDLKAAGVICAATGVGVLYAFAMVRLRARSMRNTPLSPVEQLEPELSVRHRRRWRKSADNRITPVVGAGLTVAGVVLFVAGLIVDN